MVLAFRTLFPNDGQTTISNRSGDESNNNSIMMSEQDMDAMNSGDESDHDLISTDVLEDICDGRRD